METHHIGSRSLHKDSFNEAMRSLTQQFGESMPNQIVYHPEHRYKKIENKLQRPLTFLHCGLFSDKEAVFSDLRKHGIVPVGTPSRTLLRWWSEDWWHLKIKSWQPFAKCDDCVQFRAKVLVAPTEPLRDELRNQQSMHRARISLGRDRYDFREKLSQSNSESFLHVSIDAMDNKKTNVPQTRHMSHTKKNAGGELLKTRLMGKMIRDHKIITS